MENRILHVYEPAGRGDDLRTRCCRKECVSGEPLLLRSAIAFYSSAEYKGPPVAWCGRCVPGGEG